MRTKGPDFTIQNGCFVLTIPSPLLIISLDVPQGWNQVEFREQRSLPIIAESAERRE
jgi:hypothetical protein